MINNTILNVTTQSQSIQNFDIKAILKLDKHSKLKYFDDTVVLYPRISEIIEAIEDCKNSIKHSNNPECLSLVGPYRCGKTTIIETYMKKYPDKITEEGTIKPMLYCRVPCPATIKGLVSSLLEAIGDPFYNKKSTSIDKTFRLKNLLEKCEVQLIILDEVQHLIDSNRRKLIRDSSDWFKNLIAETKIPVVFVGLEYSLQIFQENRQLGSRVLNRFTIKPFDFSDKNFRLILHRFEQSLPLADCSNLANNDIWKHIFMATQGRLGYLKVLLKESLRIAMENNYTHLTFPILAEAYDRKLIHLFELNPFLPGYNLNAQLKKVST